MLSKWWSCMVTTDQHCLARGMHSISPHIAGKLDQRSAQAWEHGRHVHSIHAPPHAWSRQPAALASACRERLPRRNIHMVQRLTTSLHSRVFVHTLPSTSTTGACSQHCHDPCTCAGGLARDARSRRCSDSVMLQTSQAATSARAMAGCGRRPGTASRLSTTSSPSVKPAWIIDNISSQPAIGAVPSAAGHVSGVAARQVSSTAMQTTSQEWANPQLASGVPCAVCSCLPAAATVKLAASSPLAMMRRWQGCTCSRLAGRLPPRR